MRAQRGSRIRDGLDVWVEIALGGDQRSVPGDLPEHVDRDTGIGHPSKAGVAEVVTAQMLVAELGDDLIPVGCVPQHRRGDPAAAWTREDVCRGVMADRIEAYFDERTDFFNERDGAGSLSFGALIDEATRARCRLPPDRQVHLFRSMSAHRTPDTSPIRAAVQAAKMTTSPQPSK